MDAHAAVDDELVTARLQGQVAVAELVVALAQRHVVHRQRQQLELLAVQHQRRQAAAGRRVAAHDQLRMDQGVVLEQLEGQVGLVDQVVGGPIILEIDSLRLFAAHIWLP
ncbi:hypothetical protein D9M71_688210 [compost metagenome]